MRLFALAYAAGKAGAPAGPRVAPDVTAAIAIDLPERVRRSGSKSLYPFESLTEVGMVFGVKGKQAKSLSSVISNANRKWVKPITDEAGNPTFESKVIVSDGKEITVPDTERPRINVERKFAAIEVDAEIAKRIKGTALEGSTALIRRVK